MSDENVNAIGWPVSNPDHDVMTCDKPICQETARIISERERRGIQVRTYSQRQRASRDAARRRVEDL